MGLFDSLFGGNELEETVNRIIRRGGSAAKMIQSILSELGFNRWGQAVTKVS